MDDCKRVHEMIAGCPACCPRCHAEGNALAMRVQQERLRVCCALVSAIMKQQGGSFDPESTDDLRQSGAFLVTLVTERRHAAG